eukprot:1309869-Alexandrium_andersonii.AAC.1
MCIRDSSIPPPLNPQCPASTARLRPCVGARASKGDSHLAAPVGTEPVHDPLEHAPLRRHGAR